MIRFGLLAAAGAILASFPAGASATGDDGGDFLPGACTPTGTVAQATVRLQCGTVAVPRQYESPSIGTYRLAVRVLRASPPTQPAEAALLLIPADPGAPGLSAEQLVAFASAFPDRDIVAYDPRGAGASEPHACGSADDKGFTAAALSASQLHEALAQSARDCLAEAEGAGISPEEFGSSVNALDADLIRQALGYRKLDVIATAYGATTALELAARHPDTIRSLTLDSPYIGTSSPLSGPENWARARQAMFKECEQDASCIAAYPELAAELDRVLADLRRTPLAVPVPPVLRASDNVVQLDAVDFEALLFNMAKDRSSAALIPALVRAVAQRRTVAVADALVAGTERRANTRALPAAAVPCRDGTALHEAARLGPTAADEMAKSYGILAPACGSWAGSEPTPNLPVVPRFPVIALSGLIDPLIPPANARTVAYLLGPVVRQFEFPSIGHAVLAQSGCALQLTQQFIANPTGPLSWNCAREQPLVEFRPPSL